MLEPFHHPDVIYADDIEPFVRLKLHILNLGHTYMAEIWRRQRRSKTETVGEFMSDPDLRGRLLSLYDDEVRPGFAVRGMEDQARSFIAATVERFDNPYLNHRISDIFDNHVLKVEARVRSFITWVHTHDPNLALPRLADFVDAVSRHS